VVLSVSNLSSGRCWELDKVPAVGDPTHIGQLGSSDGVSAIDYLQAHGRVPSLPWVEGRGQGRAPLSRKY
jgi:hypothetical protein